MNEATLPIVVAIICVIGVFIIIGLSMLGFLVPSLGIFGGLGWFLNKRSKEGKAMLAAAQSWPSTPGEVIKSRVQVRGGDHTTVSPYIMYNYQVGGMDFSGTQIRAGEQFYKSHTSQQSYDMVDKYPVGAKVTVYYNPKDPTQAAL
ncbi:MAG: DUF3592 domain-containing protein, partial [Chloroflexota bacterium]